MARKQKRKVLDKWKCRLYPGDAKAARTKLLAWLVNQKVAAERKRNSGAHADASPAKRQRTKPKATKPKAGKATKPKASREQPKASRKQPSSTRKGAASKRAKEAANQ